MKVQVEKKFLPKYAQVMADIALKIESGEYPVGSAIPPLSRLEGLYPYNRLTILRAINQLAQEGWLRVEQGRGSFVKQRGASSCIGILFGEDMLHPDTTPFCSLLAKAAQDFFRSHESELKFYIEHTHLLDKEMLNRDLTNDVERGFLRGLITAGSNAPLAMARSAFWKQSKLPWVDISVFDVSAHRIVFDRSAMMAMGLDYIHQRGGRRVAALGLGKDAVSDEISQFQAQVEKRGLVTREEWLPIAGEQSERHGYEAMRRIWSLPERPDSVVIIDDIVGKGAAQAMLTLGIQVPDTFRVICHANKGSGIFYPFSIPRIEFDPEEIMSYAGKLLMEVIEEPDLPPKTMVICPKLRLEEDEVPRLAKQKSLIAVSTTD